MKEYSASDHIFALRAALSSLVQTICHNKPETRSLLLRHLRLESERQKSNGLTGAADLLSEIVSLIENDGRK